VALALSPLLAHFQGTSRDPTARLRALKFNSRSIVATVLCLHIIHPSSSYHPVILNMGILQTLDPLDLEVLDSSPL